MADSIPDLTLLKECETHFHNKFDEFFRSTSPRKIVQIEIVGFRPFLNSTGNSSRNISGPNIIKRLDTCKTLNSFKFSVLSAEINA
jgi:hypothetical protein